MSYEVRRGMPRPAGNRRTDGKALHLGGDEGTMGWEARQGEVTSVAGNILVNSPDCFPFQESLGLAEFTQRVRVEPSGSNGKGSFQVQLTMICCSLLSWV